MILRTEYARELDERLHDAWIQSLQIREESNPAAWAQKYRRIAQGASPLSETGDIAYDVRHTPWCKEPMEDSLHPEIQVMVMQWPSGLAKTETVLNIIGYRIAYAPSSIFVVYPTGKRLEHFSQNVLTRSLIETTPVVEEAVHPAKGRDAGNTIHFKRFLGGSISIVTANTPSSFRGPRASLIYCDEIDDYPQSAGDEGDPISLAFKRAEGYSNAIKILTSSPTMKGHSQIENWLNKSDKRMWRVPCRRCDRVQVLMWRKRGDIPFLQGTVDWPKLGRTRHEKAVILCGHCAAAHNDAQRVRMILDGAWEPSLQFNGIRGYWLNGINSTLPPEKGFKSKLHQFAVNAHDAAHSVNKRETIKVWTNTFLAETFQEEQDVKTEWRAMYDRRETLRPQASEASVRVNR